jgi:hypothetical protein
MLAAWAKQPLLNGTPNSRNGESEKSYENVVLNSTPKYRSRAGEETGVRMKTGKSEGKNQKHSAQRHSKVSECGRLSGLFCWRRAVQNDEEREKLKARKARKVKDIVLNSTPKCRSRLSKTGKVQELQKCHQLMKILTNG